MERKVQPAQCRGGRAQPRRRSCDPLDLCSWVGLEVCILHIHQLNTGRGRGGHKGVQNA